MYFKKLSFELIVINFLMFINDIIIVVIYINNILFINFDKIDIQTIKNKLYKKFEIINLNLYIYYLDMTIAKNYVNRILHFEQTVYIEKFFIDYNIIESAIISTLIINDKFYIVENDFVIIKIFYHVYQFIINFLIYAMLNTRSNIVFAILMIF